MKLFVLHSTDLELALHDIQGFNKKCADKRQNERQVFEPGFDGIYKGGTREEEEYPIETCIFLLLFHS